MEAISIPARITFDPLTISLDKAYADHLTFAILLCKYIASELHSATTTLFLINNKNGRLVKTLI